MHTMCYYMWSQRRGEKGTKKELIQVTEFNILEEATVAKWARLFGGPFKPTCVGYTIFITIP